MKLRGGVLGLTISLATAAFVAGCGSSNNSGTGGAAGGTGGKGGTAGTTTGTGGKGGTAGTGTGGTAGSGAGGRVDGGTDAPVDAPTDVPTDRGGDTLASDAPTDVPRPVCGPFADGGVPSDAGVDASANGSFFVTSTGSATADLGGLAAADLKCQSLAAAVGLGGKTWHAYLSVEHGPAGDGGADAGGGPINARDRIGTGPWYNVRGALIANDLIALHARTGDPALFIDEHGVMIDGQWTGSTPPPKHDILTGSNSDGTLAVGKTCSDWTSSATIPDGGVADGSVNTQFVARVGHSDGYGPNCSQATTPNNLPSWNSAHDTASCADIASRGGNGRIYCFAVTP